MKREWVAINSENALTFHFINIGHAGDIIFTRPFIKEFIETYPSVNVVLVCAGKNAYLLSDFNVPLVALAEDEYETGGYKAVCGPGNYPFNLHFLAWHEVVSNFGISHRTVVHTYNSYLKEYGLYDRYRIYDRYDAPFIEFPPQPHIEATPRRSVFAENGEVFSEQSEWNFNVYLREFAEAFPGLNFFCSAKPGFSAGNVFDVSGLNLFELSELSNSCVAFLTRCSGVNAASLTGKNKYKPRCFAGVNDYIRKLWKWEIEENPVVYADDKEMIIEFPAMVDKYADVLPFQTRDMEANPGKYKVKLKDYAPGLSFGKFIKAEEEAKNCTEYLKAAMLRPNADENKNPGLAFVLSDLSDGNILDIGCSGSGLLINVLYKGIPGEKYGMDFEGPAEESVIINRLTGDIRDGIDLPDGYFQNITCLSALKYRADTERFAREVSRLLTPGGKLYLGFDRSESGFDKEEIAGIIEECRRQGLVLPDGLVWEKEYARGILRFDKPTGKGVSLR